MNLNTWNSIGTFKRTCGMTLRDWFHIYGHDPFLREKTTVTIMRLLDESYILLLFDVLKCYNKPR